MHVDLIGVSRSTIDRDGGRDVVMECGGRAIVQEGSIVTWSPWRHIELIVFARERVGYKAPEEIVFLSAMPLNATGKVDRSSLLRMAEQRIAANNPTN